MTHAHRWRLATPDGGETVEGRCKGCRKRQTFPAYMPSSFNREVWGEVQRRRARANSMVTRRKR